MLSDNKITKIFYIIDDFCIEFEKSKEGQLLDDNNSKKRRNRSYKLSDSEVITIMIMFHEVQFRNIKHFYINYVMVHHRKEFPQTVSYNRFVELQQKAAKTMLSF